MYTMGDVARGSIGKPGAYHNEELLYRLFGINAELLIDLAWGYEPCRMEHIKAYQTENNSVGSGQVLHCPYTAADARLVVKEMTRQTEWKQELDEYEKAALDEQLHELDVQLRSEILSGTQSAEPQAACAQTAGAEPQPRVIITYFVQDDYKEGGAGG